MTKLRSKNRNNRVAIKKNRLYLFFRAFKTEYFSFAKENVLGIVLMAGGLILVSGVVVFFIENAAGNEMFDSFFDSLWWAVVTYTTVGYGDKSPETISGRSFSIVMMLAGLVITSVVSGTIASILVDRKIREGRGLQDIVVKDHLILCGWNSRTESIIEGVSQFSSQKRTLVLINEADPEFIQELLSRFRNVDLRYVRGDFTVEKVLRRASIEMANSAIIVSDESGENSLENADERVILASLSVNAINAEINISAELINAKNEQHLRRAHVDDIILSGDFNGFLHASAIESPGIPALVSELLNFNSSNQLNHSTIPPTFIGRSFSELALFFIKDKNMTLLGLLSREKKMSMEDMLGEGTSSIDQFIQKKFSEAEIGLFSDEKSDLQLLLNPGSDYLIRDTDTAFVIKAVG